MNLNFNEVPKAYGTFHIICLIISLIFFVCCFLLARKRNDKKDSFIVFVFSIILIATEIWKQISRTKLNGGNYPFSIFPFQLCSIPMYLGFIQFFIKNNKVKETIYRYIALSGIIGGLAMLTVPMVIFTKSVLYTVHSVFWHMVLVGQGVYLIKARNYGVKPIKEVLPCIPIIAVIVTIAVILNATPYGFNLLSLSTKFKNDPPLLDAIYQKVDYPIYVIIVFLGLIAGLLLVDFVVYIIRKILKLGVKHEN